MATDILSNLATFARLPGRHRVFAGVGLLTFVIIAHLLLTERIPYRFQHEASSKGSYRPLHGHRLSLGPYLEPWRANLHGLLHDDGSFLDAESLSLEETDELDEQGRAGLQRLSDLAWSETESGQADRASIDRGTMTASRRMELVGRIEELLAHYKVSYYIEDIPRIRNIERLSEMAVCLRANDCRPGQTTIVLGGSSHWPFSIKEGNGGEDIWALSTIRAIEALGHTVIYTYDTYETADVYAYIPELVSTIIWESRSTQECGYYQVPRRVSGYQLEHQSNKYTFISYKEASEMLDKQGIPMDADQQEEDPLVARWGWLRMNDQRERTPLDGCAKRAGFEQGIPIWKMLNFNFWPGTDHPLGHAWTLSPEHYAEFPGVDPKDPSNFYLGYTLESDCMKVPTPPLENRLGRAFIFTKVLRFIQNKDTNAWWSDEQIFTNMHDRTGIDFIAAADTVNDTFPFESVENVGRLPRDKFYDLVGHSKAVLGVGSPRLSPTPYEALCFGLPFIHPIMHWNGGDPEDKSGWRGQHDGLLNLTAPYVYHVRRGDFVRLEQVLQEAIDNPIERFVLPRMKESAVRDRTRALLYLDWQTMFHLRRSWMDPGDGAQAFLA